MLVNRIRFVAVAAVFMGSVLGLPAQADAPAADAAHGAKLAYTYTESRAFDRVARLTGLPIIKTESEINGKRVFVYAMEF